MGLLASGFPLIPFVRLDARIFLLVSRTNHSLKRLRSGVRSFSPLALSTVSLTAMNRTPFCGKTISVYIPTCR